MLFFRNVVDYITKYSEIDYTLENDKLVLKDYYKNKLSERKAFELYAQERGVYVFRSVTLLNMPQKQFDKMLERAEKFSKKIGHALIDTEEPELPNYKLNSFYFLMRVFTMYDKNGFLLIRGCVEDVERLLLLQPSLKKFIVSDNWSINVEMSNGKPIGEGVKALWSEGFPKSQLKVNDL